MQAVRILTMNRKLNQVLSAGLLAALAALFLSQPAAARPVASGRRLQPVDEAKNDLSLVRFRAQLQAAVARRDVAALLQSTDPELRYSFGTDGGRQSFAAHFGLTGTAAESSPLWAELERVLALGGAFVSPTEFCAPYVFARFPDDLDAFSYVVVTAPAAPLRQRPAPEAPMVATLRYDIVRRDEKGVAPGPRPEWVRVLTATGKVGYLRDRDLRSPIDYRACFHKEADRWLLTTFVAGD
jgi:hypothetical protein